MNDENIYKTSDIALAAALQTCGMTILETIKYEKRVFFLFRNNERVHKLIELYYSNRLRVSPLTYFTNLRSLRTRIYNLNIT